MAVPWRQAIIVGASSGIGEELAKQLAAGGCRVALVARREAELRRIAGDIGGRSARAASQGGTTVAVEAPAAAVLTYAHDVVAGEEVPALFQQICRDLGGLDLVIYSAGLMPHLAADEYSFAKDRPTIEVNCIGAVAWLNEAAERFMRAGGGTIVGISSVAGDRGRRGYPVYGASKAFLDHYLEALRNRLSRFGVSVVTIKPGPVATPMTEGRDKLPMLITAPEAARQIIAAASHRAHTAYVPWKWRPVAFILRNIPSFLFRKLSV